MALTALMPPAASTTDLTMSELMSVSVTFSMAELQAETVTKATRGDTVPSFPVTELHAAVCEM